MMMRGSTRALYMLVSQNLNTNYDFPKIANWEEIDRDVSTSDTPRGHTEVWVSSVPRRSDGDPREPLQQRRRGDDHPAGLPRRPEAHSRGPRRPHGHLKLARGGRGAPDQREDRGDDAGGEEPGVQRRGFRHRVHDSLARGQEPRQGQGAAAGGTDRRAPAHAHVGIDGQPRDRAR
jgi:hypothetical protein